MECDRLLRLPETKRWRFGKPKRKIDNDELDLFRESSIDFPDGLRKSRFP